MNQVIAHLGYLNIKNPDWIHKTQAIYAIHSLINNFITQST